MLFCLKKVSLGSEVDYGMTNKKLNHNFVQLDIKLVFLSRHKNGTLKIVHVDVIFVNALSSLYLFLVISITLEYLLALIGLLCVNLEHPRCYKYKFDSKKDEIVDVKW